MQKKLVSIVLPVYNGEKHIRDSIESIINQSYQNWELIIVNDCSIDCTMEIVSEYQKKDNRIKVISNTSNLKLPRTLNVGFTYARGDYWTWTSDDNIYKKNAIERMVEELEENPDFSMVYADYFCIDGQGDVIGEGKLGQPSGLINGNVCGACFMYTAEIAKEIGEYDPLLFLAEDYDYWIRIYRQGLIKHVRENLYYYRKHSESLTEQKSDLVNKQTYHVLEKNFLFLYMEARKYRRQYQLFDQMLRRVSLEDYDKIKKWLLQMDYRYRFHLIIRKWLDKKYKV